MARTSRNTRTRARTRSIRGSAAPRPLPWVVLGAATALLRQRSPLVRPADRARLRQLVAQAGGRGLNLSARERTELAGIVARAQTPARPRIPGARR